MKKIICSLILMSAFSASVLSANSFTDTVKENCEALKKNVKEHPSAWIAGAVAGIIVGTGVTLTIDYFQRKENSILGRLLAKKKQAEDAAKKN